MNRATAQLHAETLVGSLQITYEEWDLAADRSLTPDIDGRLPGDEGYIETVDPHWLAAEAVTIRAIASMADGGVESFTSEGSTFKFATADLHSMAAALRSQSVLSRIGQGLGQVTVDGALSDYRPRSGDRVAGRVSMLGNGAIVPADLDWS